MLKEAREQAQWSKACGGRWQDGCAGTQNHQAEDQKKMHQVNWYEARTGIVLKQHLVAEKEGELTRVKEFLIPSVLHGRLTSADALSAQTRFCQAVIAAGGDDLLFVKQHQPTLYEEVSLFLREPPVDCLDGRTASTTNSRTWTRRKPSHHRLHRTQ